MEIKIFSPIIEKKIFQVNDDIVNIILNNLDLQDKLKQMIEESDLLKIMKIVKNFKPSIIQIIECDNLEGCLKKLEIPIKYDISTNMRMIYKDGELTKSAYQLCNGHYFLLRLRILYFLEENKLAKHK
jgi:hypothetical protein